MVIFHCYISSPEGTDHFWTTSNPLRWSFACSVCTCESVGSVGCAGCAGCGGGAWNHLIFGEFIPQISTSKAWISLERHPLYLAESKPEKHCPDGVMQHKDSILKWTLWLKIHVFPVYMKICFYSLLDINKHIQRSLTQIKLPGCRAVLKPCHANYPKYDAKKIRIHPTVIYKPWHAIYSWVQINVLVIHIRSDPGKLVFPHS